MTSSLVRSARRTALTIAVTGIAAFGSVAVAPAAFAADSTDGSAYTIEGNGNGPDAFVVTSTGRIPVFFCEDVKPGKDGLRDPKDVAKAEEKAVKEVQKAIDEAANEAQKAADETAKQAQKAADEAAKNPQKAAEEAAKAAQKAADEAAKAAKDAKDANKPDKVDRVMKQHNICIASPSVSRF